MLHVIRVRRAQENVICAAPSALVLFLLSSMAGMDASPPSKPPCPPITAPLASLLYPCCEAGGFYCLSCPREQEPPHLCLTPESAFKHVQLCKPPPLPRSIFVALFAWQRAMIEPLHFHDYCNYPGNMYQHPPLPGRATYPGWACLDYASSK